MTAKAPKATGQLAQPAAPIQQAKPREATAASARQMLEAAAMMTVFVVILAMIADTSPTAGHVALALVIGLLVLQLLGHVNPLLSWLSVHPLTPNDPQTFTVGS